jgi:hypothetical protein
MAKGIEQGYRLVLTAIAQRQDARRAVARLKIGSFNYFFFPGTNQAYCADCQCSLA